MMLKYASAAGLGVLLLLLVLTACGGRGAKTGETQTLSTTSTGTSRGASSVSTGPVHAVLRGQNHAPKVERLWSYTVTVTDAANRALSGTVEIEFVFAGQVVGRDTPPRHPVRNGRWHDRLTFPAAAVGQPLVVRAVVHTHAGSVTLDWPIRVRR